EARLAVDAADRRRIRAQAEVVDVAGAVDAHAVAALVEAPPRLVELAQLARVARRLGLVELGDDARHRLVARVGGRAGELLERGGARLAEVLAQILDQHGAPLLDHGAQLERLLAGECHAHPDAISVPPGYARRPLQRGARAKRAWCSRSSSASRAAG